MLESGVPQPGRTAVVIPVPSLDPVLDAVAARWPGAVRSGIPAHVTVLYPFVPSGVGLTDRAVERCRELCAGAGPFRVTFERAVVGPAIVSTAPVPAGPVVALARSFSMEWPEFPPYGGRFGPAPDPHVTLALGVDPVRNAEIAALVDEALPVRAELHMAALVELTERGWRQRAVLPL
jgi:hypothetical protein